MRNLAARFAQVQLHDYNKCNNSVKFIPHGTALALSFREIRRIEPAEWREIFHKAGCVVGVR